jgi:hypothetical protein
MDGNNETIEMDEIRGPLPFFRELSSLWLFLDCISRQHRGAMTGKTANLRAFPPCDLRLE